MTSQETSNLSLADRIELKMSVGRVVDGLWIGANVDDSKEDDALRRLEDALGLIRTHDPYRYDRVRRDLSRIWVRLLPNVRASYNRAVGACQLDTRFVLDQTTDASEIASAIIHEATHARLEHWDVTYEEALRHRIESVCVRQEVKFVRRLPDASELHGRLKAWLAEPSAQVFWTDASFEKRRINGIADALGHLGVPRWVIAVALRIHKHSRWLRREA